jgi:hypothetical protein
MNNQVKAAIAETKKELLAIASTGDVNQERQYPWNMSVVSRLEKIATDAASIRRIVNTLEEGFYEVPHEVHYDQTGFDQNDLDVLRLVVDHL